MEDINITAEVHKLVDEKFSAGVLVQTHWIAQEILAQHDNIEGDDAAWYRVCTFKEVCRIAKSAIGKFKAEGTTSDQLLLPGFKHLCKAYPLTREGDLVLVPVDQCTDQELLDRAEDLDKMAKGCVDHAAEIREYVALRKEEAAA